MKEFFSVLRISREDLLNVADKKDKKLIKNIKNLSDDDMKGFAKVVGDYIYDGDTWDDACRLINGERI